MVLTGLAIFVGLIAVLFILELVGLGFFKFFEPKREDIRREIFENTKSYVHGKIQELAKYKHEYDAADAEGKQAIEALIRSQFAEFDEQKIDALSLRTFLTRIRGY